MYGQADIIARARCWSVVRPDVDYFTGSIKGCPNPISEDAGPGAGGCLKESWERQLLKYVESALI